MTITLCHHRHREDCLNLLLTTKETPTLIHQNGFHNINTKPKPSRLEKLLHHDKEGRKSGSHFESVVWLYGSGVALFAARRKAKI
ncbi:unnamed protein product [Knipowitschia caucasica]|uniref:Uncharacterized protein n=1 Tax=Knipowitschia caucasica TaxID=637954 RepID=A0AAV2LXF5_KNICA